VADAHHGHIASSVTAQEPVLARWHTVWRRIYAERIIFQTPDEGGEITEGQLRVAACAT
jgi:hypothetical protein